MGPVFDSRKEVAPKRDVQWTSYASFGLVGAFVIVILAWGADEYQGANQAKDGVAFPLKVAFGRDSSIRFEQLAHFEQNTHRFL